VSSQCRDFYNALYRDKSGGRTEMSLLSAGGLADYIPDFFLNSFLKGLIAAFFGAIATYLVYLVRRRIPARLAWGLSDPANAVFVLATSAKIDTGTYFRYASGLGQIRAISILVPSFIRAYQTFQSSNVLLSEEAPTMLYGHDLIVIGGTKNNALTADLLDKIPNLPYTQNVNDIVDNRTGEIIVGIAKDHKIVEDYGVIIKTRNPYNPKATCLIFFSTHTYGLDAAAVAFVEQMSSYRYMFHPNYACLVRCHVTEHYVSKPQLVDFRPFKFAKQKVVSGSIGQRKVA
jgi:hypothetical protein